MNAGQLFINHTKLSELINPEMVIYNLQSNDKESVLREIVDHVNHCRRIEENKDILERILDRESLSSTGMGYGFAFPHVRIKTENGPIMCLGISKGGIEFDALDNKPVHVILLIIWKPEVPGLFNHLFGGIAKFLSENQQITENVLAAENYEQIARIFSPIQLQISPEHGHIQGAKLLLRLQNLINEKKTKPGKKDLAKIDKEISLIREELDPTILSRFDRLNEKFGAGVIKIENGVCQGCMIKLSTSLASIIKQNSGDIFVCQKCGRYIVG